MSERRKTSTATVITVVWSCFIFYLCSGALVHQRDTMGADAAVGYHFASIVLYSVIYVGGLAVIALVKFIGGKR